MTSLTDDDLFRLRDAYLAEHAEISRALRLVRWHAWARRQMQPPRVRIVDQIWRNGVLVSEREVPPLPDPEPPLDE